MRVNKMKMSAWNLMTQGCSVNICMYSVAHSGLGAALILDPVWRVCPWSCTAPCGMESFLPKMPVRVSLDQHWSVLKNRGFGVKCVPGFLFHLYHFLGWSWAVNWTLLRLFFFFFFHLFYLVISTLPSKVALTFPPSVWKFLIGLQDAKGA